MIKVSPNLLRSLPLLSSIALNIGLAGVVVERSISSSAHSPSTVPSPIVSVPPANSAPTRFRWSEIESADLKAYVQNLRDIGCPEEAIRRIIEGKVTDLYAQREQELTSETPTLRSADPAHAQRVQALRQEQATFLASILPPPAIASSHSTVSNTNGGVTSTAVYTGGGTPAAAANNSSTGRTAPQTPTASAPAAGNLVPSNSNSPANRMMSGASDRPSVFPAAMVAPEAGVPMNEGQQTALNQIQNDFNSAVGDPAQNLADPAYRNRWQNAQWLADQRFRAMYGSQAFAEMQKRAYLESLKENGLLQP
jgi:hypothetical protein